MITEEQSIVLLLLNALSFAIIAVIGMHIFRKYFKTHVIWIVDDSLEDQQLIMRNLEGKRYKVKCFSSPKSLHIHMAIQKPDAVIADYKLDGFTIDGDRVVTFCKRHDIPVVIVTGYDGEIKDIDPSLIIKKSTPYFYKRLNNWVTHAVK